MHLIAILFLAACGSDIDTDIDTDTEGGATTPPGTADVIVTLDGEPGPWTREAGETGTVDASFTWWNSSECADCDGVAVIVADGEGYCTDLDSAGPEPGASVQVSEDVAFTGRFVDDSISLFLQEDLDCATFSADRTSLTTAPVAVVPLTQEVDLNISETSPESLEIDVGIFATVSLALSEPADIHGFPPTITFDNADGDAVSFSAFTEGRFLRIDPDDTLDELQTEYTVTVSGLVGTDGAQQDGTFSLTFTTELVNANATYELYSVALGENRVLQAGAGTSVVIDDNAMNADGELWRFTQVEGPTYTIQNAQTDNYLTAPASNPVGNPPTLEVEDDTNDAQVWTIVPSDTGWRLSTVQHGDTVILDSGDDSTTPLAFRPAGSTDQQRWRFTKVEAP